MFGAVFIGSTLVLTAAPAVAAPGDVLLTFNNPSDTVELGEAPEPNTLAVTNNGDLTVCLLGLDIDEPARSDFAVKDFVGPDVDVPGGAGLDVIGEVSGAPRGTTDVTATLTYALADEEGVCAQGAPTESAAATWSIEVTEPEPSPPPTEEPTEEPSETPTETPSETPSETPDETPSPTPTSTPPRTPTSSPTNGNDEESASSGPSDRASNTPSNPRTTPSTTPDRTPPRGDVPTSGADIPDLPRGEADLPELPPGSAEDLAELPLVTPSSDDEDTETEIAADHSDMGPSVTPAILLAAFLLALLLAAPLAPTRRVRLAVGGGYHGKRRKG
ncbi:hypothetical protein [Nocardiopsis listeri]|uniref:hypothetical protein n=1 Tax=Nocardiopsis listeri TaxID=53440 RepID=UPI00082AA599|nr:hypothetical protein [Nocardiopsis listeri]